MKTVLSKTRYKISLVLAQVLIGGALVIAGSKPALSNEVPLNYVSNCSPEAYYGAFGPSKRDRIDPILTATIIGDPNCRVYLYGFNNNGDLVKLNSYGVVGDRVEVYSLAYGRGSCNFMQYFQVYFPKTRFWAWLPDIYLRLDRTRFHIIDSAGNRSPFPLSYTPYTMSERLHLENLFGPSECPL